MNTSSAAPHQHSTSFSVQIYPDRTSQLRAIAIDGGTQFYSTGRSICVVLCHVIVSLHKYKSLLLCLIVCVSYAEYGLVEIFNNEAERWQQFMAVGNSCVSFGIEVPAFQEKTRTLHSRIFVVSKSP